MDCSDSWSYRFKKFIKFCKDNLEPFVKITISSAKARWEMTGQWEGFLARFKAFKSLLSTSAPIVNKHGESGSPCLTPLEELKKSYTCPLMIKEFQLFDKILQTMSTNPSNQIVLRVFKMKSHDILSCGPLNDWSVIKEVGVQWQPRGLPNHHIPLSPLNQSCVPFLEPK